MAPTQIWNDQRSYYEGERVRHLGQLYEAKMDVCRLMRPDDPSNRFLWRKCATIAPSVQQPTKPALKTGEPTVTVTASRFRQLLDMAKANTSPAPRGYITRDMAALGKAR